MHPSEQHPTQAPAGSLMRLWDARPDPVGLAQDDFIVLAAFDADGKGSSPISALLPAMADRGGQTMRKATLYTRVLRLESLGLIERVGTIRAPSGGRPERVMSVTERGRLALEVGVGMAEHLLANR